MLLLALRGATIADEAAAASPASAPKSTCSERSARARGARGEQVRASTPVDGSMPEGLQQAVDTHDQVIPPLPSDRHWHVVKLQPDP